MRLMSRAGWLGVVVGLAGLVPRAGAAEGPKPIAYTIRFPTPDKHIAEVEATIPTGQRPKIAAHDGGLVAGILSPRGLRQEDPGPHGTDHERGGAGGRTAPEEPLDSSATRAAWPKVVVTYRLTCDRRSVTSNWVGEELVVLNGAATFVTLVEHPPAARSPARVAGSVQAFGTAMDPAPDGLPNHYRAEDYDTLVDSPIVAGDLSIHEF